MMEFTESEPQKEALYFELPAADLEPDMVDVMEHIKQLAESLLYHWKKFPIILPPSITDAMAADGDSTKPIITFKDLFMAPTFDELEQVAVDGKGEPRKLSEKQLKSVKEMGEFDVESIHFPGQSHRWRLTHLLQKGTIKSQNSLLNDVALAARLVIITARNRFHSHFFSLSQSVRGIGRGLWQILDILIGMPHNTPGDIIQKVREEHQRYLVAELDIRPVCKREWTTFCDFVKDKSKLLKTEKHKTTDIRPPSIPYKFQTPKGTEVDLRLFNKDLMNKCTHMLKRILEREAKGWYIKYKDRLLSDIKDLNFSHQEIIDRVNTAIMEEYTKRVYAAIEQSDELENLQNGIGRLLVEQAKSVIVMSQAAEHLREKMYKHKEELKAHLVKSYPVRSRIPAWMNEKLLAFESEFIEQNQWAAHEEAIDVCRADGLDQAVYFLQRDLIFMRDREPVLRKELGKVRIPMRVYSFATRIWLPSRWIIKRHLHGETEVIPTVITDTPSSASTPRPASDVPKFSVEKNIYRKTSTRYPFWRWQNYLHRTLAWTLNSMFVLGVVIPWCSPFSLRALFFLEPFMPDLQLSQVNGSLCPRQSSLTQTLVSKLRKLWQHVRTSRTKFETTPDTGFLGKAFTRHLNRFWNYVLKGAMGSFFLCLLYPPACLIGSLVSLLAAITAPIWMPAVTLFVHLMFVIIYDLDHPDPPSNAVAYLFEAVIWRMLVLGLIQPVGALLTGIIACPVASALIMMVGVIRRGARHVWDSFMFHAVIKKRGRIPACDSFVARRIAGPGLASNYFYQIKPEQVLAAVEAQMELHEVNAWMDSMERIIEQPKVEYSTFVSKVFGPFSASLTNKGVYHNLEKETKHLHAALKREVDQRKHRLRTGLNSDLQNRIKLTSRELKVTVTQTAKMLESFYPDHVISRLHKSEEEFWEGRHLEPLDWQGLATQLLCEIFSSSFLTPLEEADTCFKLEVSHLNLVRYMEMLKSAEFRDDLDVVSAVHTPKGDIDVDAPFLDPNLFSPMKTNVQYAEYLGLRHRQRRRPWKRQVVMFKEIEKLEIPLPVSHPAVVTVLIYNRENDTEPIDLEDAFCQCMLRASEAVPYADLREGASVDLYDIEPDVSTPDHTTNSDPDVNNSHLAEAEGAFSEDNFNMANTPDSIPDVPVVAIEMTEAAFHEDGRQESVVYQEPEADNSCVLEVEDDRDETETTEEDETEQPLAMPRPMPESS